MENQDLIVDLLKKGAVRGLEEAPRMIETVISRIYIFPKNDTALKIYKRDNDAWNAGMHDISAGPQRKKFITGDFEFNNFLNPEVYRSLKKITVRDGVEIVLEDPTDADDELAIVMGIQDFSATLTEMLFGGELTSESALDIGRQFAKIKDSIPRRFLPQTEDDWYRLAVNRLTDVDTWVSSEKNFPSNVKEYALKILRRDVDKNKGRFEKIGRSALSVSIDCNSENLIYQNGLLTCVDAYEPKDIWSISDFDLDIIRVGTDIYAIAGKGAFDAYLKGVNEILPGRLKPETMDFYMLYAAMIASPYLFMLARKDKKFAPRALQYIAFVKKLIAERE